MEPVTVVIVGLAVLIGVSLGLLGGGGSILAVPLLAYVAGMEPREAVAGSLFVVAVTSTVSLISHARRGNVRWRIGALFGAASMFGAFAGADRRPYPRNGADDRLRLMMLVTAAAMLRRRKAVPTSSPSGEHSSLRRWRILADGLIVGLVTGMVGAGGGFLVVPALALLAGLPMSAAVGTSLVVITMKSVAG